MHNNDHDNNIIITIIKVVVMIAKKMGVYP